MVCYWCMMLLELKFWFEYENERSVTLFIPNFICSNLKYFVLYNPEYKKEICIYKQFCVSFKFKHYKCRSTGWKFKLYRQESGCPGGNYLIRYVIYIREGFKKKVRNFPHFSGVGGFEKVIFRKKKYGLKMHKIT